MDENGYNGNDGDEAGAIGRLPHHKLRVFWIAQDLVVAVRDARIRDAHLRDQALRRRERLLANGKLPKVALIACMRKLLGAIYSVSKNRRAFVVRTGGATA